MSDYLWDGSGEPDPEVRRLEQLLACFRHRRSAPALAPRTSRLAPLLAVAAVLLLVVGGVWLAGGGRAEWQVTPLAGAPQVGEGRLAARAGLATGQWIETDGESRAQVEAGGIGQVEVGPNTQVRLAHSGWGEQRLAMARGRIEARIWAPPRLFYVETPSAVAVDLGCTYSLEVDRAGGGLLRVSTGWVGFEFRGRESLTPAGAVCATRPGVGPGTPYYEDAPEALQAALRALDFQAEGKAEALAAALGAARERDAFTVWHLLSRVEGQPRERVLDRLAELAPPPEGVTRAGILGGDRRMLYRWWNRLGLGEVSLWRWWRWPSG